MDDEAMMEYLEGNEPDVPTSRGIRSGVRWQMEIPSPFSGRFRVQE
jgi:hypothetical protein